MTPRILAAVAAGGALGAVLRAAVAQGLPVEAGRWPWATFLVNVAGAFALGLVARRTGGAAYGLLGPGVCGALTTFSTLQFELYDLLDRDHVALASAYAVVSVAAGLVAVASGDALAARE